MTRQRTPDSAARRARAVELRRARWTFDAIAADLGVSKQRAHELYLSALREVPAANVEQHRAEELALIDDAARELMEIARGPEVGARTRVEAWSVLRSWAERKAKLLGLDAPAPQRVEVITEDAIDAQIRALREELDSDGWAHS